MKSTLLSLEQNAIFKMSIHPRVIQKQGCLKWSWCRRGIPNTFWFKELAFLHDFVKIRKDNCSLLGQNSSQHEDFCDSPDILEGLVDSYAAPPIKKKNESELSNAGFKSQHVQRG
ncbi:uncharacterized protein LOC131994317 isoform X2 [Stomoxys calcitrans]|uniref:uncharacterized protein LOC131994317 isoform X2 n=1 Tax=Stomoxys calcitrans TaxID=35570 RepID=UPI0027E34623|nr:uncharacterized protein LOC131994317 isoform X2 [Stomoxys calcitrans]